MKHIPKLFQETHEITQKKCEIIAKTSWRDMLSKATQTYLKLTQVRHKCLSKNPVNENHISQTVIPPTDYLSHSAHQHILNPSIHTHRITLRARL